MSALPFRVNTFSDAEDTAVAAPPPPPPPPHRQNYMPFREEEQHRNGGGGYGAFMHLAVGGTGGGHGGGGGRRYRGNGGKSPFNLKDPHSYSLYSQVYADGLPSDRWLFAYTKSVEGVFAAASSGALWLLTMVLFGYFLLTIFWLALLSIEPIDHVLRTTNIGSTIDLLSFIIALITRYQITKRLDAVISTLGKYHAMTQSIRTLHENVIAVFRANLKHFERIVKSYNGTHSVPAHDALVLSQWVVAMAEIGNDTMTNMQLMALWSLRVFLKGADVVNSYQWYGLTEREINYSFHMPKARYGYTPEYDALSILRALLRRLKDQLMAATKSFEGAQRRRHEATASTHENVNNNNNKNITPHIGTGEMNVLMTSLQTLEKALNEVETSVEVAAPAILDISMIGTLVIYLVILLPLQIYVDVAGLSLIFTPVVLFLYSFPLVLTWYVGSPFEAHAHWGVLGVYKFRRRLYKMVYHDEQQLKSYLWNARRVANAALDKVDLSDADMNVVEDKLLSLVDRKSHRSAQGTRQRFAMKKNMSKK